MKKIYYFIIILLIVPLYLYSSFYKIQYVNDSFVLNNRVSVKYPTIIIDPGHGGFDGGASTDDGFPEKYINLKISLYLRDILILSGYDVVMIREDDISLEDSGLSTIREKKRSDIFNRMKIMESNVDSIYISIHQNYFSEPQYSGMQVFYSPQFSEESSYLADCIQTTTVSLLQSQNNRKIKKCESSVYLIYNAVVPAVLVECGFLSNENEASLLKTDEYQQQITYCVFLGIQKYLTKD